jgi:hypothetical protein
MKKTVATHLLSALAMLSPISADAELEALYRTGLEFSAYVDQMSQKRDTWRRAYAAATIPADVRYAAGLIPGRWRLLVVAEELCHDSQNTVPYLAALSESMPGLDLRIVDSKTGRPVMDARRTPDNRGATPTVLILDDSGNEAGCWIERPAPLQTFYLENKKLFSTAGKHERERLEAEFTRWYERDAGATTLREVIMLVDAAARGARGCSSVETKATAPSVSPD